MHLRLAAALAAIPYCAFAQDGALTQLDPVVITATKSEAHLSQLNASVTVIDRAEIERIQPNDVADLLRSVSGLDITRTGGPGAAASVFVRGAESNHTLFLVDGVRYTTETFLNAQIQNLTPEAIERIEVVKGPRSALWGSDAIGGVINIIMRKAGTGLTGGGSLRGGSYGTRDASGRIAYGGERSHLSLDVQAQDFDGYPPLTTGTRDMGHDSLNVSANGGVRLGVVDLSARHLQASGTTEYVQFGSELSQDYRSRISAVDLTAAIASGWRMRLTASLAHDELKQRDAADPSRPTLRDYTEVTRRSLEWENLGRIGEVEIVAGLATSRSDIDNAYYASFGDSFTKDRTERHAAYAQARYAHGRFDTLAALRHTDHDAFGGNTTGNAEIGVQAWTGARLGLAAGTGFKEPELTDLHGDFGNPDLSPERSRSIELNLRQAVGARQVLTLALYENRIDDLIGFGPTGSINIDETRTRGLEAGWHYDHEALNAWMSGNLQDPKDLDTGDRLARRSAKSLQAGVGYRIGKLAPALDLQAAGKRRDTAGQQLGGYALVNASLRIALAPQLSLDLRGENLLDKDYALVDGYRTPERSAYATLRFQY